MKLLYVGETWLGSCARSMREALSRRPGVTLEEFPEDAWFPARESLVLRAMNRLSRPMRMRGFRAGLLEAATRSRPDAVMTYKGTHVDTPALRALKKAGVATVNVYPDCSPHSSGVTHRSAVGEYDLVLSTKPFHPARWKDVYGYDNACEFVPQG
ncbi:MAG: hypothetical protein IT452_11570, partial [Planctomycetia bacterium]|nr:hypothetical protein [Planctomycetia bacterium]